MVSKLAAAIVVLLCLATPAAAQNNNAVELYRQAFAALGKEPYGKAATGLISAEDRGFLFTLGPVLSFGARQRVESILLKASPAIQMLKEGTKARKADWGLDKSQGFNLLLPHLSAMREASSLLRAEALIAATDVDRGGVLESLTALGMLSAHAGQDQVLISSLVGAAMGTSLTDAAAVAIEGGAVDQKNATQLMEALGPLKAPDAYRFGEAVRGEYDMLRSYLNGPQGAAELKQMAQQDQSMSDSDRAQLSSPEQVSSMLRQCKGIYEQASAAFSNPDPQAAKRDLRQLEQLVEGGRGGPLAKLVAPSWTKMLEAKLRVQAQIAALMAQLKAIAEGDLKEQDFLNAALLLARAAAAAGSLPDETQDGIELLRVAPEALDAVALTRAQNMLERARITVVGPLTLAAQLKKCDFKILRMPEPSLDARLLGGVRAATRLALADGLNAARTHNQSGAAVPSLIAAYRASALLATDPTLARARVAQSIWVETTVALQQCLAIGPLLAEQQAQLEQALATLPAGDPFGWRKGFETDVARTVRWNQGWRAGGATPEATEQRERILKQRGTSAALARIALLVALSGQDDTLPSHESPAMERLTDIWPRAGLDEIRALEATLRQQAQQSSAADSIDMSVLDVPYDLPMEEQKSLYRKLDPTKGIVLIDSAAVQSQATADYIKPFDLLKALPNKAQPAEVGNDGGATR
jgi:hypothetical protein